MLFRGLVLALATILLGADSEAPTGRVERGDFVKYVRVSGELEALESAFASTPGISSQWNFQLNYMVPEGTSVVPGELLARFDTSDLELKRLGLEKQKEDARIAIAQKQSDIETRRQDLLLAQAGSLKSYKVAKIYAEIDPQLISRTEVEEYKYNFEKAELELQKTRERLASLEKTARAELEVVRLEYEKAELDLKRVTSDLERMSIFAGSPGIVVYEEGNSGRKIQVGDALFKGQKFLQLPNMETLRIRANVFDKDFSLLAEGMPAEVVLDSAPARIFKAEVRRLPEVAKPINRTSTLNVFQVDVLLLEKDLGLMKPGMSARVRIPVVRKDQLIVPRRAIWLAADGSTQVVKVGSGDRLSVELLDANDRMAAVSGQLEPGDLLTIPRPEAPSGQRKDEDWITVKREDLNFNISGSGTLKASRAVDIHPPSIANSWRYKIAQMAPEGSQVQVGDPLLSFDPSELMKRLVDERASLEKVQQEYEKTNASLELKSHDLSLELEEARVAQEKAANKLRQARQFDSSLKVREAEFEAELADTRVKLLEQKLQSTERSAELQLQILKETEKLHEQRILASESALKQLSIKAPISGIVIYATNWNNEKKQVGSEVHFMESVMALPDLDSLMVQGQVAEVDAGKVRIGQEVTASIDAIPERSFSGRVVDVSSIFTQASSERPIKVLQITVELNELDAKRMRPGMAVRLQMTVDRFQQVLAVPLSVVQVEDGASYLWVKQDGKPVKRSIRVGQNNGLVAIIEEGLQEGDEVLGRSIT